MIGALAGDIIGSVYEAHPIKTKEFILFHPDSRFTDDSVLTIAVAQAILTDGNRRRFREIGRRHPEGIKGAQATTLAVFLARTTRDKPLIKKEVAARFGYDLNRTIDDIRPA